MAGFVWPVAITNQITSAFGGRPSPTAGATSNHKGVDIAVPVGTSVAAAFDGVISKSGYSSARGNYIVIDDGNGTQALYQHLSQSLGAVGRKVTAGQVIAKSGNTGVSTGAHLHFEILKNGKNVNPQTFKYSGSGSGSFSGTSGKIPSSGGSAFEKAYKNSGLEEIIEKYWYIIAGALLIVGIARKK